MSIELLVTLILATCPAPDGVYTTTCHEFLVNCAVGEGGRIEREVTEECIDKWKKAGGK